MDPDDASLAVRRSLDACEFVVVCQALSSQMSHYADVMLPGVSFAESTGTYTNTERRIQMVRQAIEPLGDSRPDWQILQDLAGRMKKGEAGIYGAYTEWKYHDTSDIMAEIAALTPIYSGISHARLSINPGYSGPWNRWTIPNTILFADTTAPGKFKY